ncbi:MAG: hypothetical protein P8Z42_16850, partial [Anaerolineales bacterium]
GRGNPLLHTCDIFGTIRRGETLTIAPDTMPRRSTAIFLGIDFSNPDKFDLPHRKEGGKIPEYNQIRHASPESKNLLKLNPGRRIT